MRKIILCVALLVVIAYVFIGCSNGSIKLQVAAGELKVWDSWTINPCKYEYQGSGETAIRTVVNNKDGTAVFDMGDGSIVEIPAQTSLVYSYSLKLNGELMRIRITKLADGQGLVLQEALVLKIEPIGAN